MRYLWLHLLQEITYMFCLFMKKKSHSNVTFVTAVVLKRVTWIDMFMKKKVLWMWHLWLQLFSKKSHQEEKNCYLEPLENNLRSKKVLYQSKMLFYISIVTMKMPHLCIPSILYILSVSLHDVASLDLKCWPSLLSCRRLYKILSISLFRRLNLCKLEKTLSIHLSNSRHSISWVMMKF